MLNFLKIVLLCIGLMIIYGILSTWFVPSKPDLKVGQVYQISYNNKSPFLNQTFDTISIIEVNHPYFKYVKGNDTDIGNIDLIMNLNSTLIDSVRINKNN